MDNITNGQKDWWAPVWRGLVVDPEGKHYRRMKNSLWLFLYLLLHADRRSGVVIRKIKTICADMGLSRDTVFRWLNTLKDGGYICTKSTGRSLSIVVNKWRSLARGREHHTSEVRSIQQQRLQKSYS